jgi:DnaJ-class molecular chaperone
VIRFVIEKDCTTCNRHGGGGFATCSTCEGTGVERGAITLEEIAEMLESKTFRYKDAQGQWGEKRRIVVKRKGRSGKI